MVTAAAEGSAPGQARGRIPIIDCDVHHAMRSPKDLFPYLPRQHQERIADLGLGLPSSALSRLQLLDTYLVLILLYTVRSLPLSVWIMRGFFETLPQELEEAAYIDGASRLRTLRHIILPLSQPALVATALIVFHNALDDFLVASTMTSRGPCAPSRSRSTSTSASTASTGGADGGRGHEPGADADPVPAPAAPLHQRHHPRRAEGLTVRSMSLW
jgi:hypothetical protein